MSLVVGLATRYRALHRGSIGDGKHTVTELIDLENQRRPTEGVPKQLKVDPAMIAMLKKQNLQLNDCVPAGQIVTLRSVANTSTGGTIVVVTDRVHADNQRMAEIIARCFRLDTVGIDFLTADITKSWREVRCAVIEVNSSPTILSIAPTTLLLERCVPRHVHRTNPHCGRGEHRARPREGSCFRS